MGHRAVTIMTLAVVMATLVVIDADAARRKPDLVVTSGKIIGRSYVFRDQEQSVVWKDRTKNIGAALARRSATAFSLLGNPSGGVDLGLRDVPGLAPGAGNTGKHTFTDDFPSNIWEYGGYPASFCADETDRVAESREGNNCKFSDDDALFVVPRQFQGFIQGSIPYPAYQGVTESWGGQVTFEFKGPVGYGAVGVFEWVPVEGTLNYSVQGTSGNCTYSGNASTTAVSGTVGAAAGNHIGLNFPGSKYEGSAFVGEVMQIPVDEVCENDTFHHTFVDQGAYLSTGCCPALPDPLRRLTGNYTDSSNTKAMWSWDLAIFD